MSLNAALAATVYPATHINDKISIENNILSNLSNAATGAYGVFKDKAIEYWNKVKKQYENFHNDQYRNMLLSIQRNNNVYNNEVVQYLNSLESIRNSGTVMQRWVMANPTIRTMYYDGVLEGFHRTYVDNQVGSIGHDHADYRAVTNGVYMTDAQGNCMVTRYLGYEDPPTGLTFFDISNILDTWEIAEQIVNETDNDPTSVDGNTFYIGA